MKGLVYQLFNSDGCADDTAQYLFEQAVQRAQRHAKSSQPFTQNLILDTDAIAAELEGLLRDEFYGVDLSDPLCYHAVLTAIQAWQPRYVSSDQVVALQRCGFVQNGLLALLPPLRRWQQLNQLCQDYQHHLIDEAALLIFYEEPSALSIQTRTSASLSSADRGFTRQPYSAGIVLTQEIGLKKITEKMEAVAAMQQTLHTRQDVTTQCQSFQTVFQQKRCLIEKDRDSVAMTFVKAVVTVLSLGLAAIFGLWSVKGRETAQQIETVLQTPILSNG